MITGILSLTTIMVICMSVIGITRTMRISSEYRLRLERSRRMNEMEFEMEMAVLGEVLTEWTITHTLKFWVPISVIFDQAEDIVAQRGR